jgi:histidinol-phosphatase (PHP family)
MVLTNYHTHTKFCDGMELPVRYAEEAIKQNVKVLGYSAHAPVPFPCTWTLPYEDFQEYLSAIDSLKTKFADQLEICCGLEIDYIPQLWPQMKEMINPCQLDYFIGVVHFIDCFDDGTPWTIDGSNEEFLKGWIEIYQRGSHALIQKYFNYTQQMIRDMRPPVIGHLDKIKMQYRDNCFIPETDKVYRRELIKTLEEIASANCIVEINTRGVYKRNEPDFYPSSWVLTEMAKLKIPVMINSDAHRPNEILLLFDKAIEQLRKAGYKSIRYLSKGEWIDELILKIIY